MTRVSAFSLCVLLGSVCFGQAPTPTGESALSQTLIAKSKSVLQNVKSKDVTALNALLSNDFRIVWSDGKLHERGEHLGAAQERMLLDVQFHSGEVVRIDSSSALETVNLADDLREE